MLLLVVILTMISVPVSAQTVNGVCVSNTFTCGVYQQGHYLSIYGSNMPTGNGPGNTLVIVSTSTSCNDSGCREVIRSSSGTQTYWYESPTQINFYALYSTKFTTTAYIRVCNQNLSVCTTYSGALAFS